MSTDEYVPSEDDLRDEWQYSFRHVEDHAEARAGFDRFLVRVRRDAAREALDGLAAEVRLEWHERHHWLLRPIDDYRNDHYPEETP